MQTHSDTHTHLVCCTVKSETAFVYFKIAIGGCKTVVGSGRCWRGVVTPTKPCSDLKVGFTLNNERPQICVGSIHPWMGNKFQILDLLVHFYGENKANVFHWDTEIHWNQLHLKSGLVLGIVLCSLSRVVTASHFALAVGTAKSLFNIDVGIFSLLQTVTMHHILIWRNISKNKYQ